jgi:predicted RNase H-like nuclease (RuvC/YqgF family)
MVKFLIAAAVATSALTAAAPAAAQYASPYGNAYGYNNYGQVRALQARVDNLQRQIRHLDRRNIISNREAANLMNDARAVERRLRETARRGLSHSERRAVEVRIARLERQIWRDARDGRRYGDRRW